MEYQEIEGNLITLGKEGKFDVIAHGCNCFCTMGAGIAPQMAEHFAADEFCLEDAGRYRGDINKLGQIDWEGRYKNDWRGEDMDVPKFDIEANYDLIVVNAYTQYGFGRNHKEGSIAPLDYDALALCFRKMNHLFKGKHVGLPQIGCGLAGGDWETVKQMMKDEFTHCDLTAVIYKP